MQNNSNYVNAHIEIQDMYKEKAAELDNLQEMDTEDLAQHFHVTPTQANALAMLIAVMREPAGAEYVEHHIERSLGSGIGYNYWWLGFDSVEDALADYKLFAENMQDADDMREFKVWREWNL